MKELIQNQSQSAEFGTKTMLLTVFYNVWYGIKTLQYIGSIISSWYAQQQHLAYKVYAGNLLVNYNNLEMMQKARRTELVPASEVKQEMVSDEQLQKRIDDTFKSFRLYAYKEYMYQQMQESPFLTRIIIAFKSVIYMPKKECV